MTVCLIISFSQSNAQANKIFAIVKGGDEVKLKSYLDTTKTPINITNSKGYTPLHVLIENAEQYRTDYAPISEEKYNENVTKSGKYMACLRLLMEKGADPKLKTPAGWNALQLAVLHGKLNPLNFMLDINRDVEVRDKDGNTLLHLSLLVNPDEVMPDFHKLLVYSITNKNLTTYTTNNMGQTPLAFYMSRPRCNHEAPFSKAGLKSPASSKPATAPPCQSSATFRMLEMFKDYYLRSILTKDMTGRNAMDYMKIHNPWAVNTFQDFVTRAEEAHKEIAEYQRIIDEQNRKYNERQKNEQTSSSSCKKCTVDKKFTAKFEYDCNYSKYNPGKIVSYKLDTKVYFEVSPYKVIMYFPNHVTECKVISSKYASNGLIEYELEHYSYRGIGFQPDLARVYLLRNDGTYEGYCNY